MQEEYWSSRSKKRQKRWLWIRALSTLADKDVELVEELAQKHLDQIKTQVWEVRQDRTREEGLRCLSLDQASLDAVIIVDE